jgi:hypothetical protein
MIMKGIALGKSADVLFGLMVGRGRYPRGSGSGARCEFVGG